MARRVPNFAPGRLLELRQDRGLSHDALVEMIASQTGTTPISRPDLIDYEKARHSPSAGRLLAIADALGVPPLELTTTRNPSEVILSDLLLERHMDHSVFAEQAGISTSLLFRILTGTRRLTDRHVARFAEVLDVDQPTVEAAIDRELATRPHRS